MHVIIIFDQTCKNVHSSFTHPIFFNRRSIKTTGNSIATDLKLSGIIKGIAIVYIDLAIILHVSHLSVIPNRVYESPCMQSWNIECVNYKHVFLRLLLQSHMNKDWNLNYWKQIASYVATHHAQYVYNVMHACD